MTLHLWHCQVPTWDHTHCMYVFKAKLKKFWCLKACDRLEDLTLNAFFFFSAEVSCSSQSQPLSSIKFATWFLDEQDTRASSRSLWTVVWCVLLCLSYLFMQIWQANSWKRVKKKAIKKEMKSLNFAESNAHRKTNVRGSFETEFFSLA